MARKPESSWTKGVSGVCSTTAWTFSEFDSVLTALLCLLSGNAMAQNHEPTKLFSTRHDLDWVIPFSAETRPDDRGVTNAQSSEASGNMASSIREAPRHAARLPFAPLNATNCSTSLTEHQRLEVVLHYVTPSDFQSRFVGGSLLRQTSSAPGLGGVVKSLPFAILKTFDLFDPVPVDSGPPPSALRLESRARPRSRTEAPEPPMILFGGKPP